MQTFALFGAGRIGRIHAANLMALGARIAYVADPLPEAAAALAELTGARVSDPVAACADPAVDAVLIAAASDAHGALLRGAAAAGKAVFCEKPLDVTLAGAQACAAAVEAAGVPCMVGFQRRFDPTFAEARARLQRGAIGDAEMLVITSRDPGLPPLAYLRGSGGLCRDMLIHDFDIVRWLLCGDGDEVESLQVSGSALVDPALGALPDVDSCVVTLRTRRGRLAVINASRRAAYGYDQRFELLGSAGMLQCGNPPPHALVQADAQGLHAAACETGFIVRYRDAYRRELAHFMECLDTGAAPQPTAADGVAAQRLAEAAARALATGEAVRIDATA